MPARCKSSARTAVTAFIGIFLFALIITAIVTYSIPNKYVSFARIKVEQFGPPVQGQSAVPSEPTIPDPDFLKTELAYIESPAVLDKVIENLHLDHKWIKVIFNSVAAMAEARQLLQGMIEVRPIRNTSLIDIRVYSTDKYEAADIANEIAAVYKEDRLKEYRKFRATQSQTDPTLIAESFGRPVAIIDKAEPLPKPAYPNHFLYILVGGSVGMLLAVITAGLILLTASRKSNN